RGSAIIEPDADCQPPRFSSFESVRCTVLQKTMTGRSELIYQPDLTRRGSADPGSVARGAPAPHSAPSQARRARLSRLCVAKRVENSRFEPHNRLANHRWILAAVVLSAAVATGGTAQEKSGPGAELLQNTAGRAALD